MSGDVIMRFLVLQEFNLYTLWQADVQEIQLFFQGIFLGCNGSLPKTLPGIFSIPSWDLITQLILTSPLQAVFHLIHSETSSVTLQPEGVCVCSCFVYVQVNECRVCAPPSACVRTYICIYTCAQV